MTLLLFYFFKWESNSQPVAFLVARLCHCVTTGLLSSRKRTKIEHVGKKKRLTNGKVLSALFGIQFEAKKVFIKDVVIFRLFMLKLRVC